MKVVILAGGLGTRISEESHLKPKPMIEIGDKPILWHIMKQYSFYGYNDFIICCGYKSYIIKQYFSDYYLHNSDITFNFRDENSIEIHENNAEPWKVTVVDTGLNTMTGGRVKRIEKYLKNEQFMLTYGDGVSDINISELVLFHNKHKKIGTISTVNLGQRFGVVDIDKSDKVTSFREKLDSDGSMINAGFMVFSPKIFSYIKSDSTILEQEPLNRLASEGELMSYKHSGFWKCMDTQRDKFNLEELWSNNKAPWRIW